MSEPKHSTRPSWKDNTSTTSSGDQRKTADTLVLARSTTQIKSPHKKLASRKSSRNKQAPRPFSPQHFDDSSSSSVSKRKQKCPRRNLKSAATAADRKYDVLPDGTPFCCHFCKSPYVINCGVKSALRDRRSKHTPTPKVIQDTQTGKDLYICNACWLTVQQPWKQKKKSAAQPSEEERQKHKERCLAFGHELARRSGKLDAKNLYCPVYKTQPCNCLQNYLQVQGDVTSQTSQSRMTEIYELYIKAQELSKLKCYESADVSEESKTAPDEGCPSKCLENFPGSSLDKLGTTQTSERDLDISLYTVQTHKNLKGLQSKTHPQSSIQEIVPIKMDEQSQSIRTARNTASTTNVNPGLIQTKAKKRKRKDIGLGNGQKRSKLFESFVLEKRAYLKKKLNLCERAVQRILCYSNNFLHKKLKTENRVSRLKPEAQNTCNGILPSIEEIAGTKCCVDVCTKMAVTHRTLLKNWRERAQRGQIEARRVIAEMLIPTAGSRCNCYKFITMVTGRSRGTISRVNAQMLATGGEKEPPVHGMKKFKQAQQLSGATPDKTMQGKGSEKSTPVYTTTTSVVSSAVSPSRQLLPGNNVQPNAEIQREQLLQLQQQFEEQQKQQQQLLQLTLILGQTGSSLQNEGIIQQMIDQYNIQIQNNQAHLQHSLQQLVAMGAVSVVSDTMATQQYHSLPQSVTQLTPPQSVITQLPSNPQPVNVPNVTTLTHSRQTAPFVQDLVLTVPQATNTPGLDRGTEQQILMAESVPNSALHQYVLPRSAMVPISQQQSTSVVMAPVTPQLPGISPQHVAMVIQADPNNPSPGGQTLVPVQPSAGMVKVNSIGTLQQTVGVSDGTSAVNVNTCRSDLQSIVGVPPGHVPGQITQLELHFGHQNLDGNNENTVSERPISKEHVPRTVPSQTHTSYTAQVAQTYPVASDKTPNMMVISPSSSAGDLGKEKNLTMTVNFGYREMTCGSSKIAPSERNNTTTIGNNNPGELPNLGREVVKKAITMASLNQQINVRPNVMVCQNTNQAHQHSQNAHMCFTPHAQGSELHSVSKSSKPSHTHAQSDKHVQRSTKHTARKGEDTVKVDGCQAGEGQHSVSSKNSSLNQTSSNSHDIAIPYSSNQILVQRTFKPIKVNVSQSISRQGNGSATMPKIQKSHFVNRVLKDALGPATTEAVKGTPTVTSAVCRKVDFSQKSNSSNFNALHLGKSTIENIDTNCSNSRNNYKILDFDNSNSSALHVELSMQHRPAGSRNSSEGSPEVTSLFKDAGDLSRPYMVSNESSQPCLTGAHVGKSAQSGFQPSSSSAFSSTSARKKSYLHSQKERPARDKGHLQGLGMLSTSVPSSHNQPTFVTTGTSKSSSSDVQVHTINDPNMLLQLLEQTANQTQSDVMSDNVIHATEGNERLTKNGSEKNGSASVEKSAFCSEKVNIRDSGGQRRMDTKSISIVTTHSIVSNQTQSPSVSNTGNSTCQHQTASRSGNQQLIVIDPQLLMKLCQQATMHHK